MENLFPRKLFVEVTNRCNLACSMCVRQSADGVLCEGDISQNTFARLEPAFPGLDALILNGIGEPLLNTELEDYIQRARRLMPADGWIGFQSNGLLLTEDRARSLVSAGLDRICLSIDAISDETFRLTRQGGEVRDVANALRSLQAVGNRGLDVGVEVVLTRDNVHELPETIRWAGERGAGFAIVSQLMPYDRSDVDNAAYDTNTADAVEIYERFRRRGEARGVLFADYRDCYMKVHKSEREQVLVDTVEEMKREAVLRGVALNVDRLMGRNDAWFRNIEDIFRRARHVAEQLGMELTLPEIAPKNTRRCEFVEADGAFISWDGYVHPCYFLWHRYRCYIGGLEKRVRPWAFGSLADRDLAEIWGDRALTIFRDEVRRYAFPFCYDCSFALCNYMDGEEFENDCYAGQVPCGACLWCTGLFHCLN